VRRDDETSRQLWVHHAAPHVRKYCADRLVLEASLDSVGLRRAAGCAATCVSGAKGWENFTMNVAALCLTVSSLPPRPARARACGGMEGAHALVTVIACEFRQAGSLGATSTSLTVCSCALCRRVMFVWRTSFKRPSRLQQRHWLKRWKFPLRFQPQVLCARVVVVALCAQSRF